MLYHIVRRESWLSQKDNAQYISPTFNIEGFIHFSYCHQLALTQQRYYGGQEGLLALQIDPLKLTSPVRVENGFPHLYGPLNREAVLNWRSLSCYRALTVTLLSATFSSDGAPGLETELLAAKESGSSLVVLPELPLNSWSPAHPSPSPEDVDGGRIQLQREAAVKAGIALLGGAIETSLGARRNVAYLWNSQGQATLRYEKLHLPNEPGFWEQHHYRAGNAAPKMSDELGFPLGVQICSDTYRPFGSWALRYQGAGAILIPRATEATTFPRWRRMFQTLAQMTACYVLSVNRPAPELGVALGGPSIAVGPDGEIVAEAAGSLTVTLHHEAVVKARGEYPGYLEVPALHYASAWEELTAGGRGESPA